MIRGLTLKQRRFVSEYIKDQNATQAAIRAGYAAKDADVQGPGLLGKLGIRAAIEDKLQKIERQSEITVERLRQSITEMAEADITQAFHADGTLKPIHEIPKAVRMLLSGVEVDGERGELIRLRFADRTRLMELLGKHLRMFTDVHEVTGRNGAPLVPPAKRIDFTKWTKDELLRVADLKNGNGAAH